MVSDPRIKRRARDGGVTGSKDMEVSKSESDNIGSPPSRKLRSGGGNGSGPLGASMAEPKGGGALHLGVASRVRTGGKPTGTAIGYAGRGTSDDIGSEKRKETTK